MAPGNLCTLSPRWNWDQDEMNSIWFLDLPWCINHPWCSLGQTHEFWEGCHTMLFESGSLLSGSSPRGLIPCRSLRFSNYMRHGQGARWPSGSKSRRSGCAFNSWILERPLGLEMVPGCLEHDHFTIFTWARQPHLIRYVNSRGKSYAVLEMLEAKL